MDDAMFDLQEIKRKKVVSEETRRKMSKAHKGIKQTEESKRKISESKRGQPHSFRYGVKRSLSAETRRKMSEAHKGHVVTQEMKIKMSRTIRRKHREARKMK